MKILSHNIQVVIDPKTTWIRTADVDDYCWIRFGGRDSMVSIVIEGATKEQAEKIADAINDACQAGK
jgi:hypothetical protein